MPYYFVHHESDSVFASLLRDAPLEVEEIDEVTAKSLADTFGTTVQPADWRKESLEFMREVMKEAVRQDGAVKAHDRLFHLFDLLMQEFRTEHDVPGARYLYNPSTGIAFSGGPGQAVPNHYVVAKGPGSPPLETLTRGEYLKRVGDL